MLDKHPILLHLIVEIGDFVNMATIRGLRQLKMRRRDSWSPISLFENGTYKGWWLDPSDISSLKQDVGGTTNVTSDGDPVGYVLDKSGRDPLAAFTRYSIDANRPTYKVIDGYPCLRFNGGDYLLEGNQNLRDSHTNQPIMVYCFVVKSDSSTAYPSSFFIEEISNYHTVTFVNQNSSTFRFFGFNASWDYTSFIPTNKNIITMVTRGDNISPSFIFRFNGVELTRDNGTVDAVWYSNRAFNIWIGGSSSIPTWNPGFVGDIYQGFAIYDKFMSTSELFDLEKALAAKAGITL